MRKFRDSDGFGYVVGDLEQLVDIMHSTAMTQYESTEQFMRAMSVRVEMFTGQTCRNDTVEHFVEDLLRLGVLTEDSD